MWGKGNAFVADVISSAVSEDPGQDSGPMPIAQDPLSGHLFLFANRERTRLKILVWDGSGLWVCAKRLEKERFRWPAASEEHCLVMRPEELAMLLNGLDIAEARPRKNWLRRLPAA